MRAARRGARRSIALVVVATALTGCTNLWASTRHDAPGVDVADPESVHEPSFPNVVTGPNVSLASDGGGAGGDGAGTVDDGRGAGDDGSVSGSSGAPAPTAVPAGELPPVPVPTGDGWAVVFRDDFSGTELDPVWRTCYWWQVDGGCTIESNAELEWYRPEAVTVADGELRLTATADPQRTTDGSELPYRSGMVTTGPAHADDPSSSFAFTYGIVSIRAMLTDGVGTWPAGWLLSADKRGVPEIDIFEQYGGRPDVVTSHVHGELNGIRFWERIESEVDGVASTWHVYTVRWHPDRVVFEIDGVETGRVTDPRLVPTTPMYLVVNLAMGGVAGAVDDGALPQTLRVDEIVVSQQVGR